MQMKYFRDGIEIEIDSAPKISKTRDGHVVEKYQSKGKDGYFVTLSGTHYCAHGQTLSQAISDALWKDESKRPSLNALKESIKSDGKNRLISLNEFRLLTGACSEGCRVALARKGLSGDPMTAEDIHENFPEWGARLLNVLGWEPCPKKQSKVPQTKEPYESIRTRNH